MQKFFGKILKFLSQELQLNKRSTMTSTRETHKGILLIILGLYFLVGCNCTVKEKLSGTVIK